MRPGPPGARAHHINHSVAKYHGLLSAARTTSVIFILGDVTLASSRRFSPDSFPTWLCPCDLCAPLWPSTKVWHYHYACSTVWGHLILFPSGFSSFWLHVYPGSISMGFVSVCWSTAPWDRDSLWPLSPRLSIVKSLGAFSWLMIDTESPQPTVGSLGRWCWVAWRTVIRHVSNIISSFPSCFCRMF